MFALSAQGCLLCCVAQTHSVGWVRLVKTTARLPDFETAKRRRRAGLNTKILVVLGFTGRYACGKFRRC